MFEAHLDGEAEFLRQVQAFTRDVQQGLETAVMDACKTGADTAQQGGFKDQSGQMRKRIHWRLLQSSLAEASGEFVSPVEYSSYVEKGTRPHVIRPKMRGGDLKGPLRPGQSRRSADDVGTHRVKLRWFDEGGGIHFARVVNHPGTQPLPFMKPARAAANAALRRRLQENIAKAAERFA